VKYSPLLIWIFFFLPFMQGCLPVCLGYGGSYACAKGWNLKANEADVKNILLELKEENPSLFPPANDTNLINHQDGYWYYIYFYLPDTKEYVYTWIQPSPKANNTTFALTGFSTQSNRADYKRVNGDYNWGDNARHINKFKEMILRPIQEKIQNKQ
jgi:hypothetical protein